MSSEGGDENSIVELSSTTSTTGSGECEVETRRLRERLERLERIFNVTHFNPDLENASLLELFALQAQSKLFKWIPATDEECKFNWLVGKCFPLCQCHLRPKLGDYSPDRACRLIPIDERSKDCDPNAVQTPWFVHVFAAVSKVIDAGKHTASVVTKSITENAPPSDSQCRWNWRLGSDFGCSPKADCAFIFELGDYSLDRACRLRVDDFDDANDLADEDDDDSAPLAPDTRTEILPNKPEHEKEGELEREQPIQGAGSEEQVDSESKKAKPITLNF